MRSIKISIVVLLLSLVAGSMQAQGIGRLRSRLAHPHIDSLGHLSRVAVHETDGAAAAVQKADAVSGKGTVNGYRAVIYFNNTPAARSEAQRVMSLCMGMYPDVRCIMRYNNPYFRVLAGCCTSAEEALILLERLRKTFPESYIMRDEINVRDVIAPKSVHKVDTEHNTDGDSDAGADEF